MAVVLNGSMPSDADPGHKVTSVIRLVGLVSAGIWIAVATLWGEGPFALTYDDAFYYLEIARRIADGQGSTFDGLNSTNGYHPLWMLVCTVPFVLGLSATAALRVVLVIQAVTWGATWWFIGGLVGRAVHGWPQLAKQGRTPAGRLLVPTAGLATLLIAANPTIARMGISGLESGLVLLFGAVILTRVEQGGGRLIDGRSSRWRLGFGALLALAVLSRTDHVLLVGAIAVAMLFEPRGSRTLAEQARLAVPILAVPAVVTAAYLGMNQWLVGSPMQISGEIKRRPLTLALVVVALVVGLLVLAIIRAGATATAKPGRMVRTRTFAAATAWYGAFCLGLLAYYTLFQVQQWLWYFAPLLLWVVILLLLFVLDLCESALAEAPEGQPSRRALAPLQLLLGVPLLIGLGMQWRTFSDPEIRSIQLANKAAAEWINEGLPADAVLASWDAGILGFYADRPVVNIDGVVNSPEWRQATQEGYRAVGAFLDRDGVGYIVNHGSVINGGDPGIVRFVERAFGRERADAMVLVKSFPFTYTGTIVSSTTSTSHPKSFAVFVYRVPAP